MIMYLFVSHVEMHLVYAALSYDVKLMLFCLGTTIYEEGNEFGCREEEKVPLV